MHIFECFRKFNSVLMAILAGAAPQREAMELPSAKPRGGEPAVLQPSPSARERQSDATGLPSKQFRFIATNSWFI